MDFSYSDEQWAQILVAADAPHGAIERHALEVETGRMLRLRQQHTSSATEKRANDLDVLCQACELLMKLKLPRGQAQKRDEAIEYMTQLIVTNAFHVGFVKMAGKSRSTAHRDFTIRRSIEIWSALGKSAGISKSPAGDQPYGPLVRFVQVCVEPAFGQVKGNAVEAVYRKMTREVGRLPHRI